MNSLKKKDREINDNVTIDKNPQKSQPEVKRRPNIATTENHIRSQNIKIVPANRTYASMERKYELLAAVTLKKL